MFSSSLNHGLNRTHENRVMFQKIIITYDYIFCKTLNCTQNRKARQVLYLHKIFFPKSLIASVYVKGLEFVPKNGAA